jgi:hypothetical protein
MTYDEEIAEIIKEGGHNKKSYTDKHFLDLAKYMVEQECRKQGINTHFGYEGVDTSEDFILYLNSLLEKIPK